MATLIAKYNLWKAGQDDGENYGKALHRRTQVAIQKAASSILAESGGTANHANRLAWAQASLYNPPSKAVQMWSVVSQNDVIAQAYADNPATTGTTVADGDIEFVVNAAIDGVAP